MDKRSSLGDAVIAAAHPIPRLLYDAICPANRRALPAGRPHSANKLARYLPRKEEGDEEEEE